MHCIGVFVGGVERSTVSSCYGAEESLIGCAVVLRRFLVMLVCFAEMFNRRGLRFARGEKGRITRSRGGL